ncbi:hypothetical protein [Bradyrhizobium sp. sGM-13]|uniref:hypothetical protein n=1 Tax=Bradyrhizobium sp. sGM-13 TaxID=2831781 RepID=UPI001BCC68F3|nr:hypothetical protein [Bradyrhizobium sp. sGM-13]
MNMMPSVRHAERDSARGQLTFDKFFASSGEADRHAMMRREGRFALRRDLLDRGRGQPNIELQQSYVRSGLLPEETDTKAEWDLTVAKAITRVLFSQYRGHFWEVYCDSKQGIAWITIPLLLNDWKYVFKLSEDITPAMIIRAGGEILERFNIPRTNLDVASFIAAKKMAVRNGGNAPS